MNRESSKPGVDNDSSKPAETDLVALFKRTGVIMEGHFLLTSGLHSGRFLQCSQLLQHPGHAEKVGRLMAEPYQLKKVEVVIGPAMGGVILAYEAARFLQARALYAERSGDQMTLRRGFKIEPGAKVLVVEDAVTTGGSVQKVINLLNEIGAETVGVSVMIDRSSGKLELGYPVRSLLTMKIDSYDPESCPLCREGLPLVKPKG